MADSPIQNYIWPPTYATFSDPAEGTPGNPAPLVASQVGGIDPNGKLRTISVDPSGNQNVNVVSSVLPTGASTSANQTLEITQLTGIHADTTSIDGKTVHVDTDNVTVVASALPTGASTAALQTTGNTSLANIDTNTGNTATSVSSIDGKTPALGQALAAASVPVVLPDTQITALTPPTTVTVIQPTGTNLHTVVDSSALPTGASTSALQTALNAQIPATLGQKTSAASLAVTIASDQSTIAVTPGGTQISNAPVQNVYSTTNVTTSGYVQIIASTSAATNSIYIFDSSGQAMILALGGAGVEVNTLYIPPGGENFSLKIPAGTRISLRALTATANSGYFLISLLG